MLGVDDWPGEPVVVHVEQAGERPWCHACGGPSRIKDRDEVVLVDLPYAGRPSRLCWHKVRLCCPDSDCEMGSWTWEDLNRPGILGGSRVPRVSRGQLA